MCRPRDLLVAIEPLGILLGIPLVTTPYSILLEFRHGTTIVCKYKGMYLKTEQLCG